MPEAATNQDDYINLAAPTLTGDVRDFLLDRVKTMGKPWVAMTEDEQSDAIHQCRDAANDLVRKVVTLIASEGRKAMVGELRKIQMKDNIQCQIDFSKTDELRHELFDAQGTAVLLVIADAEPFTGEKAPAEPDPDQGDLIANAEKLKGDGKVTRLK